MISRIGMKIMSDSLDTIGTMARTVADCALFAGAVSGRDLGDPDTKPGPRPTHRHLPLANLGCRRPGNPGPAGSRHRRPSLAPEHRLTRANYRAASTR